MQYLMMETTVVCDLFSNRQTNLSKWTLNPFTQKPKIKEKITTKTKIS